MKDKSSVQTA